MNNKLVSIITIVFNGETEIAKTIESVISQKEQDVEYIVIDGNSTDNTLKVVQQYAEKIDRIISENDNGIYDAINKGISYASGQLIGIIHSGDYYATDTIANVCEEYKKTNANVIYGDITFINEIGNNILYSQKKADHSLLRKKMSIFHPSSFITKQTYLCHGLYNVDYKIAADYELFIRYFTTGLSFSYIPQNLAFFKIGGVSTTKVNELIDENIKIKKQYNGYFDALKFKYKKKTLNWIFLVRRILLTFLIGKESFDKIKLKRLKEAAEV